MFGLFGSKKRRDLDDEERATLNKWLEEQSLVTADAHYSVYREIPRTSEDGAACVIGVSKQGADSNYEGFVLEISADTVLMGSRIPPGLAGRGRELEMHSRSSSLSMAEIAIQAEEKRLSEGRN